MAAPNIDLESAVAFVLRKGVNLLLGGTPEVAIDWEVSCRHLALATLLIEKGMQVGRKGIDRFPQLHQVVMGADLAMVKLLLHGGCDINAVGDVLGWTVLQVAVAQGSSQQTVDEQEAMIILLLEEGAKTAILHSAASLPGSRNVIQLLLYTNGNPS